MRVGIYANKNKDADFTVTKELLRGLQACAIDCFLHESMAESFFGAPNDNFDASDADVMLTVGGDGTILHIAKDCAQKGIPVLGVNLGKVGFLTEVEPAEIDAMCKALARRDYTVENRSMLTARVGGRGVVALNEIVVQRSADKMITLDVLIGGKRLDSFYCDGYIVSTPTGSTAYSLSAGGSVLSPQCAAFALTPINSHSLHSRPIVIGDDEKVELVIGNRGAAAVVADGESVCVCNPGERVFVQKSDKQARFVRLKDANFYDRLLSKLNTWSLTV